MMPKTWKFVFQLLLTEAWQAVFAILLGSLTIISGVGLIGTSAYLISFAALQPSIADLQVAIIAVRFFGLSRSVFRYLERIQSHSTNLRMVSKLRSWFYAKIEILVPAKTSGLETSDILSRAMQDIETLDQFFVRVIAPPGIAVILIMVTSVFAFTIHPSLGWTILGVMVTTAAGLLTVSTIVHEKRLVNFTNLRGALFSNLGSRINGLFDIFINGDKSWFDGLLQDSQNNYSAIQKATVNGNAILNATIPILSGMAMMILLITASLLKESGHLEPIMVGVITLIVIAAFEIFQTFPQTGAFLAQSKQAVARILEIVDQQPAVQPPSHPIPINEFTYLIGNHISFSYKHGGKKTFNDLSFRITRGNMIALVGPSGAGKTSLINLLLRFWEYDTGQILLNGTDYRVVSEIDLRNQIRVSSQKPYFFPVSIRENMLMVNGNAKDSEMNNAISQAELADWIKTLPEGLDTVVGERGSRLSEGQRKRLDLARTFLSDAPFMILDEPFAGIDPVIENRLTENIFEICDKKTLILITHHLAHLEDFDKIWFLSDGKISECGTHQQLLDIKGEYYRMYSMQKNIL